MAKDVRSRHWLRALVALAVPLVTVPVAFASSAQATTYVARINFQPAAQAALPGFTPDTGQAFSAARGYGWETIDTRAPLDMTGNTRWKPYKASTDARLSGMVQMQEAQGSAGTLTPGLWEYAVPNGVYDVTVSTGDGGGGAGAGTFCCLNSVDRLTVEGVMAINNFVPSVATPFASATVTVAVSDGRLTIDPSGGVNTKINYVDIAASTKQPQPVTPQITGVTPLPNAVQVALNTSVNLSVSQPIDPNTLGSKTLQLSAGGVQVAGNYNTDAAGGSASFTPSANLAPNTIYTITVTTGLTSSSGAPFAPYTSSFTTGTSPPPFAPYAFSKVASTSLNGAQILTMGPDGDLYAGTGDGHIVRYPRAADGTLGTPESIQPFGARVIAGMTFDPANPTHLWVTNNFLDYNDAPRYSSHVSMLTIAPGQPLSAATATAVDRIIGLPRSEHDHMTNALAFGPDGKLYIAQGANTGYGTSDAYWGTRGEEPLSASILVADVNNPAAFPTSSAVNVNTDPVGTSEDSGSDPAVAYDPKAANAPLTVYAYGTRNPFTILWDGNTLYAAVNESAGGSTPAGPNNVPPSAVNLPAYNDYFTRIDPGKYYGHPNPSQGYYALNGGNPTANGDPWEVSEYPVGVQPDANYRAPDFSMGVHRSPDGSALYQATAPFGGSLAGKILVSEYSNGDDLVAVTLGQDGKAISDATIPDANNPGQALLFNNPIGVATDPVSGVVYVAEQQDATPGSGLITEIKPGASSVTPPPVGVHVNFQTASAPVPAGYTADTGAPFTGQQGWTDASGSPLNLTANTRVRGSTLSPDSRYDTMLLMQAPAGSGNATPGQWTTSLPNGTYAVTVGVGDATATNSVDQINAQSGTANAVTIINRFQPSTGNLFDTVTRNVTVTGGALTLDATGGTNTKIDFVDAVPAGADTTKPVPTITLGGTLSAGTASTYTTAVQITAAATDDTAVTGITYSLDSADAVPYTAPVTISGPGTHTVTVNASDAAGNVGTTTSTFTIITPPPPSLPTSGHIDFGTATSSPASGYTLDYGQAYDATRGYGWEDNTSGAPTSLVGNGRQRNSSASPDQRYDTFVQMQEAPGSVGTSTVGRWEYALANGTYTVTLAVGDPTATNSSYAITAERGTPNQTTLVNGYVPTSGAPFQTLSKTVTVTDGALTLDPTGGSNTKIDFVDITPFAGEPAAPTVAITLGGTLSSGTTYTSPVQVTASVTAGTAPLGTTSYSLDNTASVPYTAPFTVSTLGSHTVTVNASDAAGNVGTTTSTFTITTAAPPSPPTSGHIDFGTQASTPPSGYTLDYGQAFDATRGYGWEDNSSGAASSLVGNGRQRNSSSSPDQRYDTLVQMQQATAANGGVTTVGRWEYVLANGTYNVTLAVGDATAINSTYSITAERGTPNQATLVNGYVPTAGAPFLTVTKKVTVSDGALTLDPTGGTNTKIDFVDITPAAPDTTPPTASVSLSGTLKAGTATTYTSPVQVTVNASDDVGVKTLTYSLDGAGAQPYTAPFTVSGLTSHTVSVTAIDAAGNVGTGSSSFTIVTPPPPSLPTSGHIDFGTQTSTPPSGYKLDYGQAFDATRGYGWEDNTSGSASSLVGNGRQRNSSNSPDQRYDTLVQMQQATAANGGVTTVGKWEYTLAPGTYSVTVAVGDATAINSKYTITAERGTANSTTIINGYVPTAGTPFQTVTKTVKVTDGALTLDPTGGTNTKIDFVDITPVPETTGPTASISLGGTSTDGVAYAGDVTINVATLDGSGGSGLATTSYTLDNGAATPYAAPFVVTSDGSHTVTVTVADNAGNSFTTSQTWTETHPDITPPTATITLGGTTTDHVDYTGDVTVSVNATDGTGSGVASVTYSLDGASPATTYATAFVVTTDGPHSVVVTATDNAGNRSTATQSWTETHPDITPPNLAVTLGGTTTDGGLSYTGDVTVNVDDSDTGGLVSTTYTLDGNGPTAFNGAFAVTTDGSHNLAVTATDTAGNQSTQTLSWTETHTATT